MLCPEMAFTVNGSKGKQRVNKWLMQWLKRLGPIAPREATDAATFGNLRESVPDSYELRNSSTKRLAFGHAERSDYRARNGPKR